MLGRPKDARRLRREAQRLYERVNEVFWWEEEGTYVLGLNGRKEQIRSVASNAGHLLQSGIVPVERAGRVVKRLLADDMWSGWGIRTLSADHPAYNPFSYQRGSVWPHDNATLAGRFPALRLRRRGGTGGEGIFDAAERVRRDAATGAVLRDAARAGQLPGAVPRRERPPGVGGRARSSGSWRCCAASMRRSSRGEPKLYVNPALPDWLPEVDDPQPARRERVARDPLPRRRRRRPVQHVGLHGHALSGSWPPRQPRCRLGGGAGAAGVEADRVGRLSRAEGPSPVTASVVRGRVTACRRVTIPPS